MTVSADQITAAMVVSGHEGRNYQKQSNYSQNEISFHLLLLFLKVNKFAIKPNLVSMLNGLIF
jgi:hypothetical protein